MFQKNGRQIDRRTKEDNEMNDRNLSKATAATGNQAKKLYSIACSLALAICFVFPANAFGMPVGGKIWIHSGGPTQTCTQTQNQANASSVAAQILTALVLAGVLPNMPTGGVVFTTSSQTSGDCSQ